MIFIPIIINSRTGGDTIDVYEYYRKIAHKLSTDKPPVCTRHGQWVIYANGTRWAVEIWVDWVLYWIPEILEPDIEKALKTKEQRIEYKNTWLPDSKKFKAIKWIINCHPNLTAPNWYWRFRKTFGI